MAINLRCHKCYAEYELEDSMAGRFLQCSCGENLAVPGADEGSGKKCAQCGADCELESVICVNCGFNFKTGQNLSASSGSEVENDGEEESSGGAKNFLPLLKPLIAIVVIAIVALFVFLYMGSKHYGISDSAKLGTMDKIEKHLLGMRLTKQTEAKDLSDAFGAKGKLYFFDDKILEQKSRGAFSESVFVALDEQGNVCAVGGTFMTADDSVPTAGSKIMRFLRSFWTEAGLPKAEFKYEKVKDGYFSYSRELGEVENGELKARWVKKESGIPLMKSIDTVKVLKKDLAFDHIP